jgi:hypothetical protein
MSSGYVFGYLAWAKSASPQVQGLDGQAENQRRIVMMEILNLVFSTSSLLVLRNFLG